MIELDDGFGFTVADANATGWVDRVERVSNQVVEAASPEGGAIAKRWRRHFPGLADGRSIRLFVRVEADWFSVYADRLGAGLRFEVVPLVRPLRWRWKRLDRSAVMIENAIAGVA